MTKTIEEAANEAIIDNDFFMADPNHPEFVDRGLEQMRACKWIINHIFSLPLAQRLTAEEKEKIQEQYDEVRIFTENIDPCEETSEYYLGQKVVLERIFGKELFERKEEE